MGGATPKQYLSLAGRPVVQWALEPLIRSRRIGAIAVVTSPGDDRFGATGIVSEKVRRVDGGPRRQDSVLRGLAAFEDEARPDDWALVHDAARPCLSDADLESLLHHLNAEPGLVGGLLACPVRDTLKRADSRGRAVATVPRNGLWQALTPQAFRYEALRQALEAAEAEGAEVTDEAAAIERAGYEPLLVPGDPGNIKITRPGDLALCAAILERL
jgi:2-C-methyl-D-erythritol 4-phosphate cytidylyltransferase